MATLEEKREATPDLYQSAREVAFGHVGAEMAAHTGAAGSVVAIDDKLTDRDKRMLSIGTLAGAAAAIARTRFPYEHEQDTLERADGVLELARSVDARDRHHQPLFVDEEGER